MLSKYHKMHLQIKHRSGAEEWYCPSCGRRVLVDLRPNGSEVVLDPGNECSGHSGGDERLGTRTLRGAIVDEVADPDDELTMAIWNAWLEDIDFGEWADSAD